MILGLTWGHTAMRSQKPCLSPFDIAAMTRSTNERRRHRPPRGELGPLWHVAEECPQHQLLESTPQLIRGAGYQMSLVRSWTVPFAFRWTNGRTDWTWLAQRSCCMFKHKLQLDFEPLKLVAKSHLFSETAKLPQAFLQKASNMVGVEMSAEFSLFHRLGDFPHDSSFSLTSHVDSERWGNRK